MTQPATELSPTLLVLPFENLNLASPDAWTAVAVQRSLVADMRDVAGISVVSGDTTASDVTGASEIARRHAARYVLRGTLQALTAQLRFTGEVFDVQTQRLLTSLKATGNVDDLFELEDVLARQARRAFVGFNSAASQPPPATGNASPQVEVTIAPGGALRHDGRVTWDEAQSPSPNLSSFYMSEASNERFAAQYARFKGASSAWDPSFYGWAWGYGGLSYSGYGGYWNYSSSALRTPLHGLSYAGAPNGTTAYGGGHR